jgi:predicted nucleic acid-binding protein
VKELFADTGYWIAVFDPADDLHTKALDLSRSLGKFHIITTQMVLTELLNHFAGFGQLYRNQITTFVKSTHDHTDVTVIAQGSSQFESALVRYGQYRDKGWGLTDCASFLVMEQYQITEALAYDKHFEQAGFRPLLRYQ